MSLSLKKTVALLFSIVFLFSSFSFHAYALGDCGAAERLPKEQAALAKLQSDRQAFVTQGKDTKQIDQTIKTAQQNISTDNKYVSGEITCGNTASSIAGDLWSIAWQGGLRIADIAAGIASAETFIPIYATVRVILGIMGIFVLIAGSLFDLIVTFTVSHMGLLFTTGGALGTLWTFTRDLVNIVLIFLLLYYAISTIIGQWGYKAKTSIASIIISAIFINFSLFITKVLIDISNLFATVFLNQMTQGGSTTIASIVFTQIDFKAFMSDVISSITVTGQINLMATALLKTILLGAMLWAYFQAFWLLIGRVCMFIFLAITSPVAYIGGLFSGKAGADGYEKQWWELFVNQLMVAPVLFFFWMIAMRLIQARDLTQSIWDSAASVTGFLDVKYLFYLMIVIAILVKGTQFAKKLSGKVGETTYKVAKGLITVGSLAVTGAPAAASFIRTAVSKEAATAAAGKTGVEAIKTRLSFSAKAPGVGEGMQNTWDKISGNSAKNKTGISGMLARNFRGSTLDAIKDTTGFDVGKFEKKMSKDIKDEQERLLKKKAKTAEDVGDAASAPQNVDAEYNRRAEELQKKSGKTLDQIRTVLEKENKENREQYEKNNELLKAALREVPPNQDKIKDAKIVRDASLEVWDTSKEKLEEHTSQFDKEKIKTKLKEGAITKARDDAVKEVNELPFWESILEYGIYSPKDRADFIKKIKEGNKGEKSKKERLADLAKEVSEDEAKEKKENESSGEEKPKPKEGGGGDKPKQVGE